MQLLSYSQLVRAGLMAALAVTLVACGGTSDMGVRPSDSGTGTNASNYGADNGFDSTWNANGSVSTKDSRDPKLNPDTRAGDAPIDGEPNSPAPGATTTP